MHSTDQTYRLLYGLLEYAPNQSALSLKAYHYGLHFSAFMIIKQGKCLPFTCSQWTKDIILSIYWAGLSDFSVLGYFFHDFQTPSLQTLDTIAVLSP